MIDLLAATTQTAGTQGSGNYGVFAAMYAVAAMLVSTAGAIGLLWRGPLKAWEVPGGIIPISKLVVLPTAFFIVFGFLYGGPDNLWVVLGAGGLFTVVAIVCGIRYATDRAEFTVYRPNPVGDAKVENIPVLAGDELTEWASTTMAARNLTLEACFKGTPNNPYDADAMWNRKSRIKIYKRMLWLYIITMFSGSSAVAWLSYGVQVRVTGKPAWQVLSPQQLPTGEEPKK